MKLKETLESMLDIEQRLLYLANVFDVVGRVGTTPEDVMERVTQASSRLEALGILGTTDHHRIMLRAGLDGVLASAARLESAFVALPKFAEVDEEAQAALMALRKSKAR